MSSSHPDANLYPTATGAALPTVQAHSSPSSSSTSTSSSSSPSPLKLYSGWFCPFVQRVWLVLEEKQIPYTYIEVNPYHKPTSLLTLNPRGLVPTLEYNSKPLYESNVICEFLEEVYTSNNGYTPNLWPHSSSNNNNNNANLAYKKAKSRIWMDFVTSRIIPSFHRFLQFQPLSDVQGLDNARLEFLNHLKEFVKEMIVNDKEEDESQDNGGRGPFFWGKDITLVDLVIAPWAIRLWVFDHFKQGLNIPNNGPDADIWARFDKWLTAIKERPSIKATTSDKEHYLPIYQRYADDKAQSELAKATRSGRGVP